MLSTLEARAALASLTAVERQRLERIVGVQVYYQAVELHERSPHRNPFISISQQVRWRSRFASKDVAIQAIPALVDEMLASKSLVQREVRAGVSRILSASTAAPEGTGAERAVAYRRRLLERLAPEMAADQRAALAEFFRELRMAGWGLSTRTGQVTLSGNKRLPQGVVYIPLAVVADAAGVRPVKARLYGITAQGGFVKWLIEGSDHLEFHAGEEGKPQVAILLDDLRREPVGQSIERILPKLTILPDRKEAMFIDWPGVEARLGFAVPGRVRHGLTRAIGRFGDQGLSAAMLLRGLLDRGVLAEAARAFPRVGVKEYEWFSRGSAVTRERRLQAARAYPLLTPAMMASPDVRRALMAAEPLAPVLTACTGLSAPMLRRVGRLYWQRTGAGVVDALTENTRKPGTSHMAWLLNLCPPEWLPQGRAHWRGFNAACRVIRSTADIGLLQQGDAVAADFVRGGLAWMAEDWTRPLDGNQNPLDMLNGIGRDLSQVFSAHFADVPGMPNPANYTHRYAWHNMSVAVCRALLLGPQPSLRSLSERSVTWHQRTNGIRAALAAIGQDTPVEPTENLDAWLPLDVDYRSADGGSIRWLTTPAELAAEAEVMGHCVWSYDHNCLFYGSHIGAVTGADGSRSTVELTVVGSPTECSLTTIQHYAPLNKKASPACRSVLQAFAAERTKHIEVERLRAALARRQLHQPHAANALFDAAVLKQRLAVLDLYRPYLHPKLRRLGMAELAQRVAENQALSEAWQPEQLASVRRALSAYGDGLSIPALMADAGPGEVIVQSFQASVAELHEAQPVPMEAQQAPPAPLKPPRLRQQGIALARAIGVGLRGVMQRVVGIPPAEQPR